MFLPLANAGDLAQWANRLEASGYLPELVRRLIIATTSDLIQLKMRSSEGTRYSGYDGVIEVGKDYLFVPANQSVWEMGVDQDPKGKAEDLETFWTDWRQATQPPLSPELIICGRNDAMQRIIEHVQAQPSTLTVRADSQDEALAFIAAAFEQLPELARERVFTRASIVNSTQAWRQIVLTELPILLLPWFQPVEVIQAVRRGHHVLIPAGREIAESNGMVILQRPSRQAAEAAFKDMRLGQERASSLASIARRSLLSLRRQLSLNPEVQQPAWALPEKARSVLPAMLAGSWDEAIKGDQDAIAMLAGRSSYSEVVEDLVRYANESDPPVRQVGTVWFLVSKEDAWRLLARFLTKQDMEHFRQVTLNILGILDPSLELPVDERWMANMMGRSRPHSSYLREGLADTLALMSARAGDTLLGGIATGQNYTNTIVTQLLQQANEDSSGQVWTSLSDVLPLLAEAAPDSFLNAIDKALVGTDPVILKLFTDKSANSLTAKSAHPHLLWSLERLAWSPDYLSRSALFLARLTRLNPSGHLANRPSSSLRGIFLPWCPQTTATFKQRLEVLDRLRKQEHGVSWKLMLSLLPTFHNLADLANVPRWRDWKPEEQEQSFSYPEWWNATEAFVTRLLDDIGTDSSRVSDLIDIIGNLPSLSRGLVFTYLELLDPSAFDNSSRDTVWAKLRNEAFLIDTPTKNRLTRDDPRCAEIIKPYLRGQDIKRWVPEWAGLWMIFTRRCIDIEAYPVIKEHLLQFREQLEPRPKDWDGGEWPGRKPGPYQWYEIQDSIDYWQLFEQPKILTQDLATYSWFCFDEQGYYPVNTCYIWPTADLYILGWLCSPTAWWICHRMLQHGINDTLRMFGEQVKTLPIAPPTDVIRAEVELIVRRLIEITRGSHQTQQLMLDWLRSEFDVQEPGMHLKNVAELDVHAFVDEVRKRRSKTARKLTPAVLKDLQAGYAEQIAPIQQSKAEAAMLERKLNDLINTAYGLTPEEITLLWATAPPRMPLSLQTGKSP